MIRHQQLMFSFISFFLIYCLSSQIEARGTSHDTTDELIISFNSRELQEDETAALLVGGGFFFLCTSLLLAATRSSRFFYLALALELITGGGLVGMLWAYKQAKDNPIMSVLNEKGIWTYYYGDILWSDIEKIDVVQMPYATAEVIGITIKENSIPRVKEKVSGYWYDANSYGFHIFVPSMSVPLERIVSFAERFMS